MAGPHHFAHSLNPVVNGGIFADAQRDLHIHYSSSTRQVLPTGLRILLDHVAPGAFHDAAERGDAPRCHPHTRKAILSEIMTWIKSPSDRRKFILWLYGPAGAGKTAIAQSIAEACEQEGLLAASFFFSRTAIGRRDSSRVIPTIAYQLSVFFPSIKEYITMAIEDDPTIFHRGLMSQTRVLIIDPLAKAARNGKLVLKQPVFVIIDGVDESGNGQAHAEILNVLGTLAVELRPFSFIVLVASRPEYEIREAFNKGLLRNQTKSLVLDNHYDPDGDISTYLESVFDSIRSSRENLPTPWPSAADLATLVQKASGQFIYATTVVKFVNSPRHSPVKRLEVVLGISNPGGDTPFVALDSLYRHILSSVANIEEVLDILTLLVLSGESPMLPLTVDISGEILGSDVRTALLDMHALIDVPPPHEIDNGLQVYHASIHDFLMDPTRSQEFWIDIQEGHTKLANSYLKLLGRYSVETPLGNGDDNPLFVVIESFCRHCKDSVVSPEITANLDCLNLETILLANNFGLFYPGRWDEFFLCVQRQVGDRTDILTRLQNDYDRCALVFFLDFHSGYTPMYLLS